MLTFDEVWAKLEAGDESVEVEAKRAEEVGKSVLETVSAFANEPGRGGGYLILGAAAPVDTESGQYEFVGVPDPDKIQADLATLCASQITPPIKPLITLATRGGNVVVFAHIPEAAAHTKPVYITARGAQMGTFRRIGSTDQRCTDDDLEIFFQTRGTKSHDEVILPDSSIEDVDPLSISEYRRLRQGMNPHAAELSLNDSELLYALGAAVRDGGALHLAVGGLMLFGSQMGIRRLMPSMRVDYIRVEGREWVADPENRFQTIEFRGPLLTVIPRVISQVFEDVPKAFHLPEGSMFRQDVPAIPLRVIREAVVNAVMHRTYRLRQPVQIIRYANRIEIRNPGVSLIPDERLGEPGSRTRNEKIAAVLHEVNLAETKGSGIRTMRELMKRSNLSAPFFESDRQKDTFTATLLAHHLFSADDVEWLGQFRDLDLSNEDARALIFVRETQAINNAAYRDINSIDTLAASRRLQRLCRLELLQKKGQGTSTYYVPTSQLLARPALTTAKQPKVRPVPGMQTSRLELYAAIVELCRVRPRSLVELGTLLSRNRKDLRHRFIQPMVKAGLLRLTFPNSPQHHHQKYAVPIDDRDSAATRPEPD